MADKNTTIDAVYVSPAFRCVQTADAVLRGNIFIYNLINCKCFHLHFIMPTFSFIFPIMHKITELGMRDTLPLRIEPGLYEWTGFVESHFPQLYTPDELATLGYNIDLTYEPQMSVSQLRDCLKETVPDLYKRNHIAMLHVLDQSRHHNKSGNILIIVHAISLETCTRNLLGKSERPWPELKLFFGKVGLCSMVALQENNNAGGYEFVEPPGGPITQSSNDAFDWRIFLDV